MTFMPSDIYYLVGREAYQYHAEYEEERERDPHVIAVADEVTVEPGGVSWVQPDE